MSKVDFAKLEAFKLVGLTSALTLTQVLLQLINVTGLRITVTLYILALIGAKWLVIERAGIRQDTAKRTPFDYMAQVWVDFGFIMFGVILWFVAGIVYGLDQTIATFNNPNAAGMTLTRIQFLIKMIYLFLSHLTIFSFLRLLVNVINAIKGAMM